MRKPALAVVSPWPPAWSGVATYTDQLVAHLHRWWDVTVVVGDGEPAIARHPEVRVIHRASWDWFCGVGQVDRILWCVGNSMFHAHVPDLIARHGGVVLAHDARLNSLAAYWAAARRNPRQLVEQVGRAHGAISARELADAVPIERLSSVEACQAVRRWLDERGGNLAAEVLRGADIVAVHSRAARETLRGALGDAAPPIKLVTFGHPEIESGGVAETGILVCSFGFVAPEKGDVLLVEGFARFIAAGANARLRFVGHVDAERRDLLRRAAETSGVGGLVEFTGRVSDSALLAQLREATIAVHLRSVDNGESSAATAACLSAGVPVIVTDIGAVNDLPENAVLKVPIDASADDIAHALRSIAFSEARRAELIRESGEFARDNGFERAAGDVTATLRDAKRPNV